MSYCPVDDLVVVWRATPFRRLESVCTTNSGQRRRENLLDVDKSIMGVTQSQMESTPHGFRTKVQLMI